MRSARLCRLRSARVRLPWLPRLRSAHLGRLWLRSLRRRLRILLDMDARGLGLVLLTEGPPGGAAGRFPSMSAHAGRGAEGVMFDLTGWAPLAVRPLDARL